MKIVKHSGDVVNFDEQKLRRSMMRSGADENLVDHVVDEVRSKLYPGITTKQIYKIAMRMLRNRSAATAARYNLREAIRLLGPAGFYFEKYVALIFENDGYAAITNVTVKGRCVSHEIDAILSRDGQGKMVECKFHARREGASDVKVPMYILSRFNDIKQDRHDFFPDTATVSKCLIVTNNRFTADAATFAQCSGIELLSWDYPPNQNLRSLNDRRNLYPLTAMTTLTLAEKEILLNSGLILARDLVAKNALDVLGVSATRAANIVAEASALKHGTP